VGGGWLGVLNSEVEKINSSDHKSSFICQKDFLLSYKHNNRKMFFYSHFFEKRYIKILFITYFSGSFFKYTSMINIFLNYKLLTIKASIYTMLQANKWLFISLYLIIVLH
jgi:hypothetical protein